MSSHSRAKGKAKKSPASSAKSDKSAKIAKKERLIATAESEQAAAIPLPRKSLGKPRLVEDKDFKVSTDQITSITSAAMTELHRSAGMKQTSTADHRTRVEAILRNVHASASADAPESEQAEQFLLSSIIVALRPFWNGK